eukprot:s6959_g7.t1
MEDLEAEVPSGTAVEMVVVLHTRGHLPQQPPSRPQQLLSRATRLSTRSRRRPALGGRWTPTAAEGQSKGDHLIDHLCSLASSLDQGQDLLEDGEQGRRKAASNVASPTHLRRAASVQLGAASRPRVASTSLSDFSGPAEMVPQSPSRTPPWIAQGSRSLTRRVLSTHPDLVEGVKVEHGSALSGYLLHLCNLQTRWDAGETLHCYAALLQLD